MVGNKDKGKTEKMSGRDENMCRGKRGLWKRLKEGKKKKKTKEWIFSGVKKKEERKRRNERHVEEEKWECRGIKVRNNGFDVT